jgi:signal transduction histidine kinase
MQSQPIKTRYVQPIIIGALILAVVLVTNYQITNYQIQIVNQNKENERKVIEDEVSKENDQIKQAAASLTELYNKSSSVSNQQFDDYSRIIIEQNPQIKNIIVEKNGKIIESYPHQEFEDSDVSSLYKQYPAELDGVKVMNPVFQLSQSNEAAVLSVPFDSFVNPIIFSNNFKLILFNQYNNQNLYQIEVKDDKIQQSEVFFSADELQNSLIIEKKTDLFGYNLQNYYVLKYQIWDSPFEEKGSTYEQILLISGFILSAVVPLLIIRYQRLTNFIKKQSVELGQAHEKLLQTDKAKDEFAAMLSHELKTPLVPIQGYVDILLSGHLGNLTDVQKERLQVIKDSSRSLLKLISDILDVQKLDLGQLKIVKQRNNIKDTVEKSVEVLKTVASEKNIELVNHVNGDIFVSYDEERIKQVITNLIKNSMNACSQQTGKIEIIANDSPHEIEISVKDNGKGIPAEYKDNVFRKFYQVDTSPTRESGGSGLGLAICKGIIETHGGKLWFESEYGKGTTFIFTIPK